MPEQFPDTVRSDKNSHTKNFLKNLLLWALGLARLARTLVHLQEVQCTSTVSHKMSLSSLSNVPVLSP